MRKRSSKTIQDTSSNFKKRICEMYKNELQFLPLICRITIIRFSEIRIRAIHCRQLIGIGNCIRPVCIRPGLNNDYSFLNKPPSPGLNWIEICQMKSGSNTNYPFLYNNILSLHFSFVWTSYGSCFLNLKVLLIIIASSRMFSNTKSSIFARHSLNRYAYM